jgi:hypothetical protein
VLEHGLERLGKQLGLGQSEVEHLKETGTSVGSVQREEVPARSVVETGNPYWREQGRPPQVTNYSCWYGE